MLEVCELVKTDRKSIGKIEVRYLEFHRVADRSGPCSHDETGISDRSPWTWFSTRRRHKA